MTAVAIGTGRYVEVTGGRVQSGRLERRLDRRRLEKDMERIEGYVEHIIFRNQDNGYTVLNVVADGEELTCVGPACIILETGKLLESTRALQGACHLRAPASDRISGA